jgi:hypothetical protein
VVGLALIGGDDDRAEAPGPVPSTPQATGPVDPSPATAELPSPSAGSMAPAPMSTSPPNCETIPTLSLHGPDADVEMDLVFFACGEYDADGDAMFDPAFVPEQPVVASGTVSLAVEPPGAIAVAVAPWEPGMTWSTLEADVSMDPSSDGSYVIELPTTGCTAIVASLWLEPGEGRFIALAESALGACAAAAS